MGRLGRIYYYLLTCFHVWLFDGHNVSFVICISLFIGP